MSKGETREKDRFTPEERRDRERLRRRAHLIPWKPTQFVHRSLEWDNAPEVQELKAHYPKRFLVWDALFSILDGRSRQGWAAYNTLASQAGCDRRTAMLAVQWLMAHGMLLRRYRYEPNGDNAPNYYMLLAPPSLRGKPMFDVNQWAKDEVLPPRIDREESPVVEPKLVVAPPTQESKPQGSTVENTPLPTPSKPVYAPGQGPDDLVMLFHRLVHRDLGELHVPLRGELAQAQELLSQGWDAAEWAVRAAVRAMGSWRPDVFGGCMSRAKKALARYQSAGREEKERREAEQLAAAQQQLQAAEYERQEAEARDRQTQAAAEAAQVALAKLPGLVGRLAAMKAEYLALPPLPPLPELTRPNASLRFRLSGLHHQNDKIVLSLERIGADLEQPAIPPIAVVDLEAQIQELGKDLEWARTKRA